MPIQEHNLVLDKRCMDIKDPALHPMFGAGRRFWCKIARMS